MVTDRVHYAFHATDTRQGIDPVKGARRIRRELRLLRVGPGDRLVVQLPGAFTVEQAQHVESMFAAEGVRVVVVGGGLRVVAMQGDDDTYTDDAVEWQL